MLSLLSSIADFSDLVPHFKFFKNKAWVAFEEPSYEPTALHPIIQLFAFFFMVGKMRVGFVSMANVLEYPRDGEF